MLSGRDRVPLAKLKLNFSRYVREVQERGRAITITQHGRDAAVLAPLESAEAEPKLAVRARLDRRPLGEIIQGLKGLPGGRSVRDEDVQQALDWTRADRS